MFGLTPYNTRRNQMQNRNNSLFDIDRVFENFFNDSVFPSYYKQSGLMKVDIKDDGDSYLLEAELPGIKKENINIDVEDGNLTISVNQDEQTEEKNESYICRERRACSMRRSFSLDSIDTEKISAKMDNGLLTLRLPKIEPTKPAGRKVEID